MLKHCVFLKLNSPSLLNTVQAATTLLAGLVGQVEGMIDFVEGPNHDFENLSVGYGHGFIVTFADREAHLAYERHPVHVQAGALLVSACRGGLDGIFVADLEVR